MTLFTGLMVLQMCLRCCCWFPWCSPVEELELTRLSRSLPYIASRPPPVYFLWTGSGVLSRWPPSGIWRQHPITRRPWSHLLSLYIRQMFIQQSADWISAQRVLSPPTPVGFSRPPPYCLCVFCPQPPRPDLAQSGC